MPESRGGSSRETASCESSIPHQHSGSVIVLSILSSPGKKQLQHITDNCCMSVRVLRYGR